MKKLLVVILFLAALGLGGCSYEPPATLPTNPEPTQTRHVHQFETEWTAAADAHQRKCETCGETESQAHTDQDGVCTVCGWVSESVGLAYTLSEDGNAYTVTGIGSCTVSNLRIPETHDSKPVTAIAEAAFANGTALRSVILPQSITKIGSMAFHNCTSLQSVQLPDKLTELPILAFFHTALTEIELPDSLTEIGAQAFTGTRLTEVTIPDSVTSIGYAAFQSCTQLERVTLPEALTEIDDSAFFDCAKLTRLTIPKQVNTINFHAFYGCTALEQVVFENTVGWSAKDLLPKSKWEQVDVSDPAQAAIELTTEHSDCNWVREDP